MDVSLFHGVDNILECILIVLICTQYMLSSSTYVLYVPKSILSALTYRGVGDFTKREMKLTLISTFKYQVFDRTKIYPFLSLLQQGGQVMTFRFFFKSSHREVRLGGCGTEGSKALTLGRQVSACATMLGCVRYYIRLHALLYLGGMRYYSQVAWATILRLLLRLFCCLAVTITVNRGYLSSITLTIK